MFQSLTLPGFVRRLFHRFSFGDAFSDYSHLPSIENPRLRDLPFEPFFGSVAQALPEARLRHKTLFIYIYCVDNPLCASTEALFRVPAIAQQISANYLFCPLSITASDGYSIATGAKFRRLPLLLLVRPTGESVRESTVFVNLQGPITESGLMASLGIEQGRAAPAGPDRAVEFEPALPDEGPDSIPEPPRANGVGARMALDFAALPDLAPTDPDTCTVRFHLPNNAQVVRTFPRSAPARLLFAFAEHFVAPTPVALYAGVPPLRIENEEAPIGSLSPSTYFVVYTALIL
jgi:hypothetical protein